MLRAETGGTENAGAGRLTTAGDGGLSFAAGEAQGPLTLDEVRPDERNAAIEWPTLLLALAIHVAFLALTWFHASIAWWLFVPLAAWTSAWFSSFQHEVLHGHPTRSRWFNTALATPPYWLWLPFERYKQSHLKHHRDERLTDPLDDPESRYWTPDGWRELGPIGRKLVAMQSTLLGRLVIGPLWSSSRFLIAEARAIRAGDRDRARIWAWHAVFVALTLTWVLAICGMPSWLYVLGFVYGGTALALIRSFAEHRAHDAVEKRTAIVEKSPVLGLLFLNNNLHVVHHRWPTIPWYRLPGVYRENRDVVVAHNGGLVYDGYKDVFRRFFLKAHDTQVHPTGRAPMRDGTPPGSGR